MAGSTMKPTTPHKITYSDTKTVHTWDNNLYSYTATDNCFLWFTFHQNYNYAEPKRTYAQINDSVLIGDGKHLATGCAFLAPNDEVKFKATSQTDGNNEIRVEMIVFPV